MSLSMTVATVLTAWLVASVLLAGLLAMKRDTDERETREGWSG